MPGRISYIIVSKHPVQIKMTTKTNVILCKIQNQTRKMIITESCDFQMVRPITLSLQRGTCMSCTSLHTESVIVVSGP